MKPHAFKKLISPSVPLTLEVHPAEGEVFSETFELSWGMDALARFEDRTGESLMQIDTWGMKKRATFLRAALWAAACTNHPEYETEEGFKYLSSCLRGMKNSAAAFDALWDAYLLFLPEDQAKALGDYVDRQAKIAAGETVEPADPFAGQAPAPPAALAPSDGSISGPSLDTTSASATPISES